MFEGFALERIDVGEAELRVRYGGGGPPVLLLHGHPRTHATWHRVAPLLAQDFTVVCPDLRGYGESSKPPTTPDHAVRRVALMDGIPIGETLARCDAKFAAAWYHWFFFAQTRRPAERFINADPGNWYTATDEHMGAEAFADYQRAIHDPDTVHAMMEDYRAGLDIDRAHDDDDRRAGRKISCPVLFLWAAKDDLEDLYGDPLQIWRDWAEDVRGRAIGCGHHIAEEAPDELAAELRDFFGQPSAEPPRRDPRRRKSPG